eukprot:gene6375-11811_t
MDGGGSSQNDAIQTVPLYFKEEIPDEPRLDYENPPEAVAEALSVQETASSSGGLGIRKKRGRPSKKAEFEWSDQDVFTLIEIWSSKEELYNSKNPRYGNRDFRLKALVNILQTLQRQGIKVRSTRQIQDKFTNLRNYYAAERRKIESSRKSGGIAESEYKSSWKFFHPLHFLQDNSIPRENAGNLNDSFVMLCQQPFSSASSTSSTYSANNPPSAKAARRTRERQGETSGKRMGSEPNAHEMIGRRLQDKLDDQSRTMIERQREIAENVTIAQEMIGTRIQEQNDNQSRTTIERQKEIAEKSIESATNVQEMIGRRTQENLENQSRTTMERQPEIVEKTTEYESYTQDIAASGRQENICKPNAPNPEDKCYTDMILQMLNGIPDSEAKALAKIEFQQKLIFLKYNQQNQAKTSSQQNHFSPLGQQRRDTHSSAQRYAASPFSSSSSHEPF